ncbi:MAG: Stp1/IreP family PP2C-type Ser/Thr phosphatase [Pseudomonadota bacterium]
MRLAFAGGSDVGCVREENQDSIFVPAELPPEGQPATFFLADGMGGRKGGSIASQTAVAVLQEYFAAHRDGDLKRALNDGVQQASMAIYRKSEEDTQLRGMGTTIVALAILGDQAVVANVGDSRCYRFRNGRLSQITEDHSLVAQQVREGVLSPQEAKTSPMRNLITKAAGAIPDVEPDLFNLDPQPGDVFLMCSDGLHGPVEESQMAKVLSSRQSLPEQVRELVHRANRAGGPDNISVILVRVGGQAGHRADDKTARLPGNTAGGLGGARRYALKRALLFLTILGGAAAGLWWYLFKI